MKTALFSILMASFCAACSNPAKEKAEKTRDSVEQVELKQVDEMLQNEDSLLKAKEAELLEKYGN